jgi:hypothetical protein
MLNFAEQTGSGAVIVVWSFLLLRAFFGYLIGTVSAISLKTSLRLQYRMTRPNVQYIDANCTVCLCHTYSTYTYIYASYSVHAV